MNVLELRKAFSLKSTRLHESSLHEKYKMRKRLKEQNEFALFKGRFPRIVRSIIFVNFHYAPYKKSYFIYVGNPGATRKALSEACI